MPDKSLIDETRAKLEDEEFGKLTDDELDRIDDLAEAPVSEKELADLYKRYPEAKKFLDDYLDGYEASLRAGLDEQFANLAKDPEYVAEIPGLLAKLNLGRGKVDGSCSLPDQTTQPYPRKGRLAKNLDLSLDQLQSRIGSDDFDSYVYCYVVSSVRRAGDAFEQTGCAPNWQGDLITLCTCKHHMRSFLNPAGWQGKWIAGFTGKKAGGGRNALVYLMRVERGFCSHAELWTSPTIPQKTKMAKAADKSRLGDLYRPAQRGAGDPFTTASYVRPEDHVHLPDKWQDDISYCGCSGRPATLLVGEPKLSFLWRRPMVLHKSSLHRGQKKCKVSELLEHLEQP